MKKLITIGCLFGLVISMCGLPLFYAFQKHLHKQSQFNYILHHPQEKMEGLVRITVDEIDNLPMGYEWEETGAEFRHQGMLFDIVSVKKINSKFEITALADELEVTMEKTHDELAHQQQENNKKAQKIFKWVFAPYINETKSTNFVFNNFQLLIFPRVKQDILHQWNACPYMPPKVNA